jgi:porin
LTSVRRLGAIATLPVVFLALAAVAEAPPATRPSPGLTGDWGGLRTQLAQRGVVPYASYVTGFFANVHGGIQDGIRYLGFADWGADLDLDRLAGWQGGRFHIGWISYHGGMPSEDLVGVFPTDDVSGWESSASFRFYEIYLEQTLLDGALRIKAGQLCVDDDFFVSRYAGSLLNAAFAFFGSGRGQQLAPYYPLAAPGLYVTGRPSEHWTLRAGAYTGDPGEDESSNFGFGWSFDDGASFLAEIATHRLPMSLPGTYTLGLGATTAALTSFQTGATVNGSWGFYFMADQALLLRGDGEPRLGAFLRAGFDPVKTRAVLAVYGNAGLSLYAPFPNRPDDVVALGVAYTKFATDYLESVRASGQSVTGHEAVLELSYQAKVTDWLLVQPDFQVAFDPHFSGRDALVLGLQSTIRF